MFGLVRMERCCKIRILFTMFIICYSTVEADHYSDFYQTYYMNDFCNNSERAILVEDNGQESVGMLKLTQDVPYEIGVTCTTVIKSPQNYSILIDIVGASIRTNNSSLDCVDRLQIISGNGTYHWPISSPICGMWMKGTKSKLVYFAFGYIIVQFISSHEGENKQYTGFSIVFTAYNSSEKGVCHGEERFHCNNNACIWKPLACDGYSNCRDSSDEASCRKKGNGNISLGIGGYIGLSFAILLLLAIILFLVTPPLKRHSLHATNISTVSTSYHWSSSAFHSSLTNDGLPSYEEATRNIQW